MAAQAMSAPTLAEYWESVECFCGLCRESLGGAFVAFIVVGSLSVDDAVPGWSDVDGFLIVREATERMRGKAARLAHAVAERFSFLASDRGPRFSVIVAGREEVLRGGGEVSFLDQWDIRRHGIVACGEDLRDLVEEPAVDRAWLDRHTDWMIASLAKDGDAPRFWKVVNSVGFILSGARVAVLKQGEYAKRKDAIEAAFVRSHPEKASILRRAMAARLGWPEILERPEEVAVLYEEAMDFLTWVRTLP